jgi:hypothetical protein
MRVELDVFSGRPNPSWEADETCRREIERIEDGLAAAAGIAPPPLGYRGFRYRIGGEERRAYGGRISRAGRTLADPGRTIERLLLASAPPALADVAARIAPLLDAPAGA